MSTKKYVRNNIGSIVKSRDPLKSDYIQIRKDLKAPLVLNAGDYIQVETKAFQLASLERAVQEGKLPEEHAAKARERIEKIPDFVRAELVVINTNNS
jgi:hypothetical protein